MRISDWSSDVCSSDLIEEMAEYASVPVINGLTDASHPCQIMADMLTIIESGKQLPGLKVAWLGDGNNVLDSIMEVAGLMQIDVRSEERSVGKARVSKCRSRWSPDN